jgi:hypothetical protein
MAGMRTKWPRASAGSEQSGGAEFEGLEDIDEDNPNIIGEERSESYVSAFFLFLKQTVKRNGVVLSCLHTVLRI